MMNDDADINVNPMPLISRITPGCPKNIEVVELRRLVGRG
jgi:hypothetical protein